jgi:hypothetical protein
MADIPECFSDYRDDRRFVDRKFSSRANMQRKLGPRPTKNSFAYLAPLRFRRYFNNNDARFVSGRILKGNVNVTVRFNFENNDAACESEPFIFNPGALRLLS